MKNIIGSLIMGKALESLVFFGFLMAGSLAIAGPTGTGAPVTNIVVTSVCLFNGTLDNVPWEQLNLSACSLDQLNALRGLLVNKLNRIQKKLDASTSPETTASLTTEKNAIGSHISAVDAAIITLRTAPPKTPPSP